jgi:hypothetical protein
MCLNQASVHGVRLAIGALRYEHANEKEKSESGHGNDTIVQC